MIKNIEIENFKVIRNANIECANLTVFTGVNGMGKSSVIQSLILLRQSFLNSMIKEKGLSLKGEILDIGIGKDVLFQYAEKEEINLSVTDDFYGKYEWRFGYETDSDMLPFSNSHKHPLADLEEISLFNNQFQYIQAEHWIPTKTFDRSDFEVVQKRSLGYRGEYAPHYLAVHGREKIDHTMFHIDGSSNILLHQSQAWLGEISPGTKINAQDIPNLDAIKLTYQFETDLGYTDEFKHFNVGFGITYSLPVIVALLSAKSGDLVIIENPESHLHPRGQAAMGKLISLAAQRGVQVIVETHSDHILNACRVAIKKEELDKNNFKIYYFERNEGLESHSSKITEILIDKKGELSSYPKGFMDEWGVQLNHLI